MEPALSPVLGLGDEGKQAQPGDEQGDLPPICGAFPASLQMWVQSRGVQGGSWAEGTGCRGCSPLQEGTATPGEALGGCEDISKSVCSANPTPPCHTASWHGNLHPVPGMRGNNHKGKCHPRDLFPVTFAGARSSCSPHIQGSPGWTFCKSRLLQPPRSARGWTGGHCR